MPDWVTIEDIEEAYFDFLRHKRSKESAYSFSTTAHHELSKLCDSLNNRTYEIGVSVAFCVTKPKLREVFAADSADRIVHHLLIIKFNDMFEHYSIDNSFNCRKGKGNTAMTAFVHKALLDVGKNGWVMRLDVKGCFMSIDKDILWMKLVDAVSKWCDSHEELLTHKEDWLWLWKKVVYHRPERHCVIHGDPNLFKKLPADKTLFKTKGKGLAIGNLTSQILANFYFSNLDHRVKVFAKAHGGHYGRYMDDMFFTFPNKKDAIDAIQLVKEELSDLALHLNPNKVYIQKACLSVSVIGTAHCDGRIYAGKRTVGNAWNLLKEIEGYSDEYCEENAESIASRVNAYMGFMREGQTYKKRLWLWNNIPHNFKRLTYCKNMKVVKVKKAYKKKYKRELLLHKIAKR